MPILRILFIIFGTICVYIFPFPTTYSPSLSLDNGTKITSNKTSDGFYEMEISGEDFREIDTYIISHIEGCWHELKYKTISNINQNITISHLNLDEISCILTSIEDNYGR